MRNINRIEHPTEVALEAGRATESIFWAVHLGAFAVAELAANAVVANDPRPDVNDTSRNSEFFRKIEDALTTSSPTAYLTIVKELATAAEAIVAKTAGHETWAAFEAAAFWVPELVPPELQRHRRARRG
jgi:hypothetical protein